MAVMVLLNEDAETLHALRAIRSMMEIPSLGPEATVAELVQVIWERLAPAFGCAVPQVVELTAINSLVADELYQRQLRGCLATG